MTAGGEEPRGGERNLKVKWLLSKVGTDSSWIRETGYRDFGHVYTSPYGDVACAMSLYGVLWRHSDHMALHMITSYVAERCSPLVYCTAMAI